MPPCSSKRHSGFTLVELSIVLVIIGLILGGVMIGREMIRQTQVKSIMTALNSYEGAIKMFGDKYNALPGDMTNATSLWGTNPGCATGGAGTGTQTCNGDGNGMIGINTASGPYEQFVAWQHLANAGFIKGKFTGGLSGAYYICNPNINCPGGAIAASAYYLASWNAGDGSNGWWYGGQTHVILLGRATTSGYPLYSLLTPAEAYGVDIKMDDGKPGLGRIHNGAATVGYDNGCAVRSNGTALADGTAASAADAVYAVTNSAVLCALMFDLQF